MKNTFNLILAAMMMAGFSSCAKDPHAPAAEQKLEPAPKIFESGAAGKIYSVKKQAFVSIDDLASEALKYRVIFVGDNHTSNATHEFFDAFLRAVGARGYKIHLANEWFSPLQAKILGDFTAGKIDATRFRGLLDWDKAVGYDWNLSLSHYNAVKNFGGRLYGINLTREQRKKISGKARGEMSASERTFYESLDLSVRGHKELVMGLLNHCLEYEQHASATEPCNERMYRVQTAWDSFMAQEVARINGQLGGQKEVLIVFAGQMHTTRLSIPMRFARLDTTPFYIIGNWDLSGSGGLGTDLGAAQEFWLANAWFLHEQ